MREDKDLKRGAELSEEELDGVIGGLNAVNAMRVQPAASSPMSSMSPSPQPSIPSIPPDPGLASVRKNVASAAQTLSTERDH